MRFAAEVEDSNVVMEDSEPVPAVVRVMCEDEELEEACENVSDGARCSSGANSLAASRGNEVTLGG